MTAPILVYRFQDAPEELRRLSTNGGDEDWIAVVPPGFPLDEFGIGWIESPRFGCYRRQKIERPDGSTVYIGCHA